MKNICIFCIWFDNRLQPPGRAAFLWLNAQQKGRGEDDFALAMGTDAGY